MKRPLFELHHRWGFRVWRLWFFWRDLWTEATGFGVQIDARRTGYVVEVGFGKGLAFRRGHL